MTTWKAGVPRVGDEHQLRESDRQLEAFGLEGASVMTMFVNEVPETIIKVGLYWDLWALGRCLGSTVNEKQRTIGCTGAHSRGLQ